MGRFTIREKTMSLENGQDVTFPFLIVKTIDFRQAVVVLLRIPAGARDNENVYGVSHEGLILWRVPVRHPPGTDSPYTDIRREGTGLALINADGTRVSVDPASGEILGEGRWR